MRKLIKKIKMHFAGKKIWDGKMSENLAIRVIGKMEEEKNWAERTKDAPKVFPVNDKSE